QCDVDCRDVYCFPTRRSSDLAYEVDGDVYFRVSKIEEYGQLSGIKIEDLVAGASERVDENNKKEESTDFALWKKTDEGIRFDSRSEEHTSELQSRFDLVCRLL